MFNIIFDSILIAWLLTLFGADEIISDFIFEWFGKRVSSATYYVLMVILGIILGIIFWYKC